MKLLETHMRSLDGQLNIPHKTMAHCSLLDIDRTCVAQNNILPSIDHIKIPQSATTYTIHHFSTPFANPFLLHFAASELK